MDYSSTQSAPHTYHDKYYLPDAAFTTQEYIQVAYTSETGAYTFPPASQQQQYYTQVAHPPYQPPTAYPNYDHLSYASATHVPTTFVPTYAVHVVEQCPEAPPEPDEEPMHIHAPIPISAYSTLLPCIQHSNQTPTPRPPTLRAVPVQPAPEPIVGVVPSEPQAEYIMPPQEEESDYKPYNPVDCYAHMQQLIFPTPCELLTELAARNDAANASHVPPPVQRPVNAHASHYQAAPAPSSSETPSSRPAVFGSNPNPNGADNKSGQRKPKSLPTKKPENQRKAHFRAVAENIGFELTDPDTISSHDKKRHYLECIEQYVLWLHEHIRRVGGDPVQFERVTDYSGMENKSMRTLLVLMQDECRELHHKVLNEERVYGELKRQVLEMESKPTSSPPPPIEEEPVPVSPPRAVPSARRHSIASGMIPLLAAAAHSEQYPGSTEVTLHGHFDPVLGGMTRP